MKDGTKSKYLADDSNIFMVMKPFQTTLAFTILVLLLSVQPAMGLAVDGKTSLHQVGIIPANTFSNFIWNNTLYNAEGYAIRCYNIAPGVSLSSMSYKKYDGEILYPEKVQSLYISAGKLYVTTSNTFNIADLRDRLHPRELGQIIDTSYSLDDVIVSGNYAYVSGPSLSVFDISDSLNPKRVTTYGKQIGNLATDGKYLYGVHGLTNTPKLTIYSISNPKSPVYVSNMTFPTITHPTYGFGDIAYKDNTVYIPQYDANNLFTIDVTNRADPVILNTISSFTFGAGPVDVDIVDNNLYLSVRYGGIRIYDIAKKVPVLVGSQKTSTGYSEEISSNGRVTVMARNSGGTAVYDTSNKTHPVVSTNLNVPSSSYVLEPTTIGSIDVLGQAGRNLGSWYWNITVPEETALSRPLAEWSIGNPRMFSMPWVGNYSYTALGSNGGTAYIVNLTGLGTPGFVPHTQMYAPYSNVLTYYASESRLYATLAGGKFNIYDNTKKDTASPKLLSSTDGVIETYSQLIPYHKDYLLAEKSGNLLVVNIKTDTPVVENTFDLNKTVLRMSYDKPSEKVYALTVAGGKYYVRVIDVADKNKIHWDEGNIKLNIQGRSLISNGSDVFVVGRNVGSGNMMMVSFSDPAAPKLIDSAISIDGDCDNTAFYKGYVYCGGFGAITIYKVTPPSTSGATKP